MTSVLGILSRKNGQFTQRKHRAISTYQLWATPSLHRAGAAFPQPAAWHCGLDQYLPGWMRYAEPCFQAVKSKNRNVCEPRNQPMGSPHPGCPADTIPLLEAAQEPRRRHKLRPHSRVPAPAAGGQPAAPRYPRELPSPAGNWKRQIKTSSQRSLQSQWLTLAPRFLAKARQPGTNPPQKQPEKPALPGDSPASSFAQPSRY